MTGLLCVECLALGRESRQRGILKTLSSFWMSEGSVYEGLGAGMDCAARVVKVEWSEALHSCSPFCFLR